MKMGRRPSRSAMKANSEVPHEQPGEKGGDEPATPLVPNRPGVVAVRMPDFTSPGAI